MIGTLHAFALETRDPVGLAEFYQKLLGGRIEKDDDEDWVELIIEDELTPKGRPHLAFQLSPGHEPPEWPGEHGEQQAHLDIAVDDLDKAESVLLESGARYVTREDTWRVYLDPAGHPFCTVV